MIIQKLKSETSLCARQCLAVHLYGDIAKFVFNIDAGCQLENALQEIQLKIEVQVTAVKPHVLF